MIIDKKNIYIAIFFLIIGIITGYAIGHVLGEGVRQALALEKAKPPVVKEILKTVMDTKLQYVPGETVYLPSPITDTGLIAPVPQDTPGATPAKLDGKFTFNKPDFVYMVNGKVGKFTKRDEENFIFEKNMMDFKQTNTITIQAEIPTIDLTRHNILTVGAMFAGGKVSPGAGYTGSIGKVGAYQLVGSQLAVYVGVGFKF